jgi:hypothetical protein
MSHTIFPFLIIPIPTNLPVGYGIDSTSGPNKCLLQCRGLIKERELIQEAADRINLSYGMFMRPPIASIYPTACLCVVLL